MTSLLSKPRGATFSRGQWFLDDNAEITIVCPGCGGLAKTKFTHKVSDDGTVSPPLACSHCPFHDTVKLEGWLT